MFEPEKIETIRKAEMAEVNAMSDLFRSAQPEVALELGLRLEHVGSAVALIAPGSPYTLYNRVIGLGLDEPVTGDMLDQIENLYRQAGISKFAIQVCAIAEPPDFAERLESRGMTLRFSVAKFYRGVEPPAHVSTDLEIRQIGPGEAGAFGEVAGRVFGDTETVQRWVASTVGRPGWHHYMAYEGDMPVATGLFYAEDGVGWLGYGSTLPSHRNRGAQGALYARRIEEAHRVGCRLLTVDTGIGTPEQPNSSYNNAVRNGFAMLYVRPHYVKEIDNGDSQV